MASKVGYERVSTKSQSTDSQHDELTAYGCDKIFTDKATGKHADRPALTEALAYLRRRGRAGDHRALQGHALAQAPAGPGRRPPRAGHRPRRAEAADRHDHRRPAAWSSTSSARSMSSSAS